LSLLTISQISKAYFGKAVLDQVSLRLDRSERLALIGNNGAGKTTLLRLITGAEKPDSGSVIISSGVIPGYLSQHFDDVGDDSGHALHSSELQSIERELRQLENSMVNASPDILRRYSELTARFETLGGYDFAHRMEETLAGLGLQGDILSRPLTTLSGGERMRVALARLLLKSPDLLLLDEPTNHMDISAMEWLEDFLSRFKGAVLLISHDRAFIDRTATAVAELNGGRLILRPGNYSRFKEIEAAENLTRERELKKLSRELEHQKDVTQTMLSHRKMSSYHAREKVVAKLSGQLEDIRSRALRQNQRLNFGFLPALTEGDPEKILLETRGLTMGFGNEPLFSDVSLLLRGGMKACLCGPNGCGKSTLLALLLGRIDNFEGQIRMAGNVIYGHMGQHVDFDDEERTLVNEILSRTGLDEGQARSLLARYGFRDVDVFKKIGVLSGGERSRLYLACLLLEKPDVLFLDEPTNHLDIQSREILEQALVDFSGAILAVSHDRYFIERCTRQVYGFIHSQVIPFDSFSEYRKAAQIDESRQTLLSTEAKSAQQTDENKLRQPMNRARERREIARRKEETRALEKTIASLEAEKSQLEASFATDSSPDVYQHYSDVLARLDQLYDDYIALED
jgi:ATP-binding cassette, subfamily F, member 3